MSPRGFDRGAQVIRSCRAATLLPLPCHPTPHLSSSRRRPGSIAPQAFPASPGGPGFSLVTPWPGSRATCRVGGCRPRSPGHGSRRAATQIAFVCANAQDTNSPGLRCFKSTGITNKKNTKKTLRKLQAAKKEHRVTERHNTEKPPAQTKISTPAKPKTNQRQTKTKPDSPQTTHKPHHPPPHNKPNYT